MPYTPHTLVTFGGRLTEVTANDEIWECGVRGWNPVSGGGPVDEGQLQNLVDQIATVPLVNIAEWFEATVAHHATSTSLLWVKAANIAADGTYAGSPAIHEFATPVVGGHLAGIPSYNTICYSWTTGTSFGKAQRGRVYPPNIGVDIASGSTISSGTQGDLVTAAGLLLGALNQSGAEFEFEPGVFSKSGPHRTITGVRVGNVIDVQRRRRNAVAETYQAHSYP